MPGRRQPWTPADLVAKGYVLPLDQDTPEGTLLAEIRKLAKVHGWVCFHTYDSRKSEPGFPDVTLCDGTSLLMYELKTNTGKLTPEQAQWQALLAHTGLVETGIWRPSMWRQIAARLTRSP